MRVNTGCKLSTFDLHVVLEELRGVERPRLQVRSWPDRGGAVLGGEVIEHHDGLAAKIALVNPGYYYHPITLLLVPACSRRGEIQSWARTS